MLRRWLELHKPTGSARTQLLMAELMWTSVGSILLGLGLYWVVERYHGPGWAYATPFLVLGLLKALFILDRVARRTIERVRTRGDDHCLGGFFSASSWLAIVGMIVLGQVLRASPIPRADVGFLYVAVGSGLLMSSRTFWAAWWRLRPQGATDRMGDGRRPR
ncbi:MAG: hypothetical protein KKA32_05675 [Actinobacteria bacterium]|nr:hypothetical protein [Actinomycetota bacterium]